MPYSPDIGLCLCLAGLTGAFLSFMVGSLVVIARHGTERAAGLFAMCLLCFPTSLFVSFIGFILMCFGFAVQILNTPS